MIILSNNVVILETHCAIPSPKGCRTLTEGKEEKASANYRETSGHFRSGNEVITEIVGEVRDEK